jgi:hypothetical protein
VIGALSRRLGACVRSASSIAKLMTEISYDGRRSGLAHRMNAFEH